MGRHKQKGGTLWERYVQGLASMYKATCWLNNYSQRKRYGRRQGIGRGLWTILQLTTKLMLENIALKLTRSKRVAKKFGKKNFDFF